MNPIYRKDFYKIDHVSQYPKGTEQIVSNWTPRGSRTGIQSVVHFGLQHYIKTVLIKQWEEEFFGKPLGPILEEYRDFIGQTLGVANPRTDHLEELHALQHLPIDIYSIPEGFSVPIGVPMSVITNTHPSGYWIPNALETDFSNMIWKGCTSATTSKAYRELFIRYAMQAGEKDFGFVDWQGHDFAYRGMSGLYDAELSGMGHLLSFSGTDTIPAIFAARNSYHAPFNIGGSVPATEHSVMCAGSKEGELETFRRLLDIYPTGVLSVVSDTWDLWKVLQEHIPALKDKILARDGKIVIRPDSGDPVKIVCGDLSKPGGTAVGDGALRLLAKALGTVPGGGHLPMINKGGVIYGDCITLERAEQILDRTVNELKLSPYNMVFGIGSFTYEYVTRDTYGFAMKATAVKQNGVWHDIFKNPVTDSGEKKSLVGIPVVYRDEYSTEGKPVYFVKDRGKIEDLDHCAFQKTYSNGKLLVDETFDTIRQRVRA